MIESNVAALLLAAAPVLAPPAAETDTGVARAPGVTQERPDAPKRKKAVEIVGACCLPVDACTVVTEDQCLLLEGTYQGDFTECPSCAAPPPPPADGACCLVLGACVELSDSDCTLLGGTWYEMTECVSVNCAPVGACCFWVYCESSYLESDCVDAGGVFQGADTDCGTAECTVTIGFEEQLDCNDEPTEIVNGQSIEYAQMYGDATEFGCVVGFQGFGQFTRGLSAFDSDPAGPNADGNDPDLLLPGGFGNILILQYSLKSAITGDVFHEPDDASYGGEWAMALGASARVSSIDLIDIDDNNGGAIFILLISDEEIGGQGVTGFRAYEVPAGWTTDGGVRKLDLLDTTPQEGEPGRFAVVVDEAGFDEENVRGMLVIAERSAGFDNIELTLTNPTSAVTPINLDADFDPHAYVDWLGVQLP